MGLDTLTSSKALKLLDLARRGHLDLNANSFSKILGRVDASEILNSRELAYWNSEVGLARNQSSHGSISSPNLVLVLKVTRLCNLRCTYCRSWAEGPGQVMTFPVMVEAVRQVLSPPSVRSVEFVLHGGEVTLLKPRVLEKLIWIQQQLKRPEQLVHNAIQTNAVAISDEWFRLIELLKMPVGISFDGPPEINGRARIDKAGNSSTDRVVATIDKMRKAGIPFGGLVVVGEDTIGLGARALFDYFVSVGLTNLDFLNELPNNGSLSAEPHNCTNYVTYDRYVEFLMESFSIWWSEYSQSIDVKCLTELFIAAGGARAPKACIWSGNCLPRVFTIEANGDVSACDRYIGDPKYVYGSLLSNDMGDLVRSSKLVQREMREQSRAFEDIRRCRWRNLCSGGCPHDLYLFRNARAITGRACCGLSPLFDRMAKALHENPDDYAEFLRARGQALQNSRPTRPRYVEVQYGQ